MYVREYEVGAWGPTHIHPERTKKKKKSNEPKPATFIIQYNQMNYTPVLLLHFKWWLPKGLHVHTYNCTYNLR